MKILATVKRVEDPELQIKIKADGSGIDTEQMKYVVNPFDEIAVEEALRLRDAQGGEVVVATIGVADAVHQLRTALAMGADRAIHVVVDQALDAWAITDILKSIAEDEKPDLVILGKQAVDDDAGQVGIMLADQLGWGQITVVSKEESLESEEEKSKKPALKVDGSTLEALREVDGGFEILAAKLPAVVTTELRLNVPRYASLPGIMKAKKKEVKQKTLDELGIDATPKVKIVGMRPPAQREAGEMVPDVATLVDKLTNDAKVL